MLVGSAVILAGASFLGFAPQTPIPSGGGDPRTEPPALAGTAREATPEVRIEADGEVRRVFVDDELFTVYRSAPDTPTPILYPVLGPGQVPMTRRFPLEPAGEGEAKDHPHHRSVWFAHGDVNGHDFWHGTHSKDVIVHDGYLPVPKADEGRAIRAKNRWVAEDGSLVCTDERYLRFGADAAGNRFVDYRVTVFASAGELVFGDTKEGTMACRTHPALRLKGAVAKGHIVNSGGDRDGAAWGKRAAWVAYFGPVPVPGTTDGAAGEATQDMTLALFEHPTNPRSETWWHARDYGLLAANPFGKHDFEGGPADAGELRVAAGESLTFAYRFWFVRGVETFGELGARHRAFARFRFPALPEEDDQR